MNTETAKQHGGHSPHTITFTVDDEELTTEDRTLTPIEIMTLAGVDPATHYLVEIKGRQQTPYKDNPNEEIKVHPNQKFVTVSIKSTPVS